MDPPARDRAVKALARGGVVVSALAVFASGWLAMSSTDWKMMVLFTGCAAGAGLVASAFSRMAR
jgi:hypothetical protein